MPIQSLLHVYPTTKKLPWLRQFFFVQRLPIFAFTIVGARWLNFWVRNGIRCDPSAIATVLLNCSIDLSKTKTSIYITVTVTFFLILSNLRWSFRPISTGQLHESLHFHSQPITLSSLRGLIYRRSYLGVGFALRCFQRLSIPYLATRLCHWHDNRCTSGRSIPVLSY